MPKHSKAVTQTKSSRPVVGVCLFLFGLSWLVFGQTLTHDFVNYDDQAYVYENAQVTGGLTLHGIVWALAHSYSLNWHPLTWISHMLDCQLFGLNAGGHHFTSVLLHSISAVALFLVVRQMTGALWRSAFVAAIFAVHPLHVESVAWVAERKDVLSGLFFLLTLGAYTRYVRQPSIGRYLIVALFFVLGLMSKPMLVTLPLVLLVLDYWPLNRFAPVTPNKSKIKPSPLPVTWLSLLREKIPLFALTIVSCFVTLVAQRAAMAPVTQLPLTPRVINALLSVAIYLWQMFFPVHLTPIYLLSGQPRPLWELLVAASVLVGISFIAISQGRKRPYILSGWLWYLIMLVPVLGVVQVGWQAHADRYTYLPQIGLYVAICWAITDLARLWSFRRQALGIAGGLAVSALAWMAWNQTAYWHDSKSLWKHTMAVAPDNHIGFTNFGDALLKDGRFNEAIQQYLKAIELDPTDSDAQNGLGNAFAQEGQPRDATEHYRKAIELRPTDPQYHNNIGNVLCQQGLLEDGIAHYRRALELRPDPTDLQNAETEFNLANAFLRKNQPEEAILHYRRALEIQPNDADTMDNLATALLRRGHAAEAMEQYQKASRISPESASIRSDFAWALATCPEPSLRNGPRAVELAEQARRLNGQDPIILRSMAAAYAENGQFSQATETARNALGLATAQGNAPLVRTLKKELELYQTGVPFHEPAS